MKWSQAMIRKSIPFLNHVIGNPCSVSFISFHLVFYPHHPRFPLFNAEKIESQRRGLCYLCRRIFNYSVREDYTLFKWLGALAGMPRFVWYIRSLNYCNLAVN